MTAAVTPTTDTSDPDHPAAVVRRFYAAMQARDWETAGALVAHDAVVHWSVEPKSCGGGRVALAGDARPVQHVEYESPSKGAEVEPATMRMRRELMLSMLHRLRLLWRFRRHPRRTVGPHAMPVSTLDRLSDRQARDVNETKAMSGEFD